MAGRYLIVLLASGCADFAGIGDPAPLAPDAPAVPCNLGGIDLCLYASPQNALVIGDNIILYTDRDCDLVYNNPIGRSSCVLYARTITINAQLIARGTRPLVLAATERVEINGVIDVSATRLGALPAAANDITCVYSDVEAAGPGGSFAGKGGDGGPLSATVIATATPAIALPVYLRGGCAGGAGNKDGGVAGQFRAGAPSGGVMALVSGGSISIGGAGKVLANGAGGTGGDSNSPASGGGSGGMIRLGAPMISIAGTVTANGGGGGEGADGTSFAIGGAGADGSANTTPAPGGNTLVTGGDGGAGAAGAVANGGSGVAGANMGSIYDDGAGGGGAGFIVVYGGEPTITGTVSPAPTRAQ